jgi:hypothetical protein
MWWLCCVGVVFTLRLYCIGIAAFVLRYLYCVYAALLRRRMWVFDRFAYMHRRYEFVTNKTRANHGFAADRMIDLAPLWLPEPGFPAGESICYALPLCLWRLLCRSFDFLSDSGYAARQTGRQALRAIG